MIRTLLPILTAIVLFSTTLPRAVAQEDLPDPMQPIEANIALAAWGAEATGEGQPFNPGYPVDQAIDGTDRSALFGSKPDGLVGGSIVIDLALPTEIVAVVLTQASYGSHFDRARDVQITVDGRKVAAVTLENSPGTPQRFPLAVRGQRFRVTVVGQYDDPQTDFGGWNEIELITEEIPEAKFALPESFLPRGPALIQQCATNPPEVHGRPQQAKGHPRTLWTTAELQDMKRRAATDVELGGALRRLLARTDALLVAPPQVPPPAVPLEAEDHVRHMAAARAIVDLALAEQLAGDKRYGDAAIDVLSRYAETFSTYPVTGTTSSGLARIFNRRADLAAWLIHVACGYDLLHNRMSVEQLGIIGENLLRPAVQLVAEPETYWSAGRPETAVVSAAVLATGYALDDPTLIAWGLQGHEGQGGATPILDKGLTEDGLWRSQPRTAADLATEAVLVMAECAWRNGVDLYRYGDGKIKRLLDSPLEIAYPTMALPSLDRSEGLTLLQPNVSLYGWGFARYGDRRHQFLAAHVMPELAVRAESLLPACWLNVTDTPQSAPQRLANQGDEGLAVLQVGQAAATRQLLISYGSREGNPRQGLLGFDLFGFGRPLMPTPASSYSDERRYDAWCRTALANNTVVIDERRHVPGRATLMTLGSTSEVAMARVWTDRAAPGAGLDRTLVLTRDYTVDVTAAFSRIERTVDVAYHAFGELETSVRTSRPWGNRFSDRPGYSELQDVRRGSTNLMWKATWRENGRPPLVMTVPAGPETTVYAATGWKGVREVPLVIQRRQGSEVVMAAAINLNADPDFVTSVRWLETDSTSARTLKIETTRGADYLLVNYAPGLRSTGIMRTDASLVLVRTRKVRPGGRGDTAGGLDGIYMAGGTTLELLGGRITLSAPALLAIERTENSHLIACNLAGDDAEVRLTGLDLPPIWQSNELGRNVIAVDHRGRPIPAGKRYQCWPDTITMTLAAGQGFEFGDAQNSVFPLRAARDTLQHQTLLNRVRLQRMMAQERAERSDDEAVRNPVTPGTAVIVEAEDFTDQGGGEVTVTEKKVGTRGGKAFMGWDDEGHWIEWSVDVPESGYYQILLKYCNRQDQARRRIEIDGTTDGLPITEFFLPDTGGWSNAKDDWRLLPLQDWRIGRRALFYLKRGHHTLRLTNLRNSANLDYLVLASPDVPVDRNEFQ
ncbi:MAG: carbohydrate-binding protein [Planctomycetes bacterium]|nr:carbohydrate-binding protein [Planctomycetota bacterium]